MRQSLRLFVLLCIAACNLDSTDVETRDTANQFPLRAEWQSSITPMAASTVSGSAHIREYRAYYEAQMSITGGTPARTYLWRIYPGTCTNSGTTVFGGSTQAFPALVTNASGAATAAPLLAGALDSTAVYNVRVQTGAAITTTVACGNLQRS